MTRSLEVAYNRDALLSMLRESATEEARLLRGSLEQYSSFMSKDRVFQSYDEAVAIILSELVNGAKDSRLPTPTKEQYQALIGQLRSMREKLDARAVKIERGENPDQLFLITLFNAIRGRSNLHTSEVSLQYHRRGLETAIENLELQLRRPSLSAHSLRRTAQDLIRHAKLVLVEGEGGTHSLEVLVQLRKQILDIDRKLQK